MEPTVNIKPRLLKQNSLGYQTSFHNKFPTYQNNNYQRSHFPQNNQPRPQSHSQQTNSIQTTTYILKSDNNYPKKEQNLQSMARKIPQEGPITISISHQANRNKSKEKQKGLNHHVYSQSASNSVEKYPLHTSTLISKNTGPSKFKPFIPINKPEKSTSQFLVPTNITQNQIPELKFQSFSKPKTYEPLRLNKTDRISPNRKYSGGLEVKNQEENKRFFTKDQIFIPKCSHFELDSTTHTETNMLKNDQKNSLKIPKSDSVKKNSSPSGLWPLSSSPSEEKRQNVYFDPFLNVEVDKKIGENHDFSNQEFKKKKNFEFFKNLKKKSTSLTKSKELKKWTIDDFELIDKIGKGSFGDVYMAQEKSSKFLCVIKRMLKKKLIQQKLEEHLMRQIKIQSYLDHRHLTPLYGFFNDEKYIYLIQQFMPDGSLMRVQKKRKIPEHQVSFYVRQICFGLKYMHTERIIHRDIKPQNVFLNQSYAKLGDFGCSVHTKTLRDTQIGSFAYLSPEQLKLESYNQKIDVWSVGVITYEMLFGASPFEADIIQIAKQQKEPELSQLKFPAKVEISNEAKDFLIKMLDRDPKERMGIDEALRHEFILKYIKIGDEPGSSPC